MVATMCVHIANTSNNAETELDFVDESGTTCAESTAKDGTRVGEGKDEGKGGGREGVGRWMWGMK